MMGRAETLVLSVRGKMILVNNKSLSIHTIALNGEELDAVLKLVPGVTEVHEDKWKTVLRLSENNPILKHHLEKTFEVKTPDVQKHPERLEAVSEKPAILELKEKDALSAVKECFSMEILEGWSKVVTRPNVLRAIDEQMKKLTAKKPSDG